MFSKILAIALAALAGQAQAKSVFAHFVVSFHSVLLHDKC